MEQTTAVMATRGLRPQESYHNKSSRAKKPVNVTAAQPAGMVTAEDFRSQASNDSVDENS